jgi:hypothetical protein
LHLQAAAREEILANGGSLSHHHGGIFKGEWYRISNAPAFLNIWFNKNLGNIIP